ncbi:CPBP family intramembrane glutamic endopeptidase [Lysobacter sp. A286]
MSQTDARRRLLFAFSPLALVAICASIQLIAGRYVGVWAWVPTMLGFWLVIAFLLHKYPASRPRQRFQRASGSRFWSILALLAGLLSLHGFLGNWTLLDNTQLIAAWLVFALVNPWFEESYWRGLLIDSTASWGKLASVLYSSVWFAASHPLVWGIYSLPLRKPEAVGALLLVGLIWGFAYQRTGSLRWCVAGHMLANLLGLAALVLLNIYDPTI